MRSLIAGSLIMVGAAAHAVEPEEVATKAAECWALPVGTESMPPAIFQLVIGEDGYMVDATVINIKPESNSHRSYIESAMRAFRLCSPFDGVAGHVEVVMDPKNIPPKQGRINPFK